MSIISTVEDEIISQVKSVLMKPGDEKLREVETLPGAWSYDLLKRLLQKAPGVYVSFLGGTGKTKSSDAMIDGKFDVYAVTKLPNEEIRRRGNARVIGCYDILGFILPQINGHDIQDIGILNLVGVDNLFGEAMFDLGGTVYSASFTIENMAFPFEADLATLNDFATYNADHSMAPGNDEPVAQDQVTLPQ